MRISFIVLIIVIAFSSCRKAQILMTTTVGQDIPWIDSSIIHPKNAAFISLLDKYKRKGLPGISLLINDSKGTVGRSCRQGRYFKQY